MVDLSVEILARDGNYLFKFQRRLCSSNCILAEFDSQSDASEDSDHLERCDVSFGKEFRIFRST